jgi:DNA-binding transcriptional ArsR family regulator
MYNRFEHSYRGKNMTIVTPDRIAETLFGKARRRILGLLYGRPDEAFYLRQIARLTDLSVGAVQYGLAALTEAGLVTREEIGNQVHFQANPDCLVFDELRRIMEKTTGLADHVRAALAPLAEEGKLDHAFIYGSVASGKQSPKSDVDLMLVGDAKLREVAPALRSVQERISREINPSVFTRDEFTKRVAAEDHFIGGVLRGPKITLVGSEDELDDLAGKSVAD